VFGNQLGTAIGFLIPPNVVKSDTIEAMQRRFYYLLIPMACLCSLATALAIICKFIFFFLKPVFCNLYYFEKNFVQ
jgi:hypothetical protein